MKANKLALFSFGLSLFSAGAAFGQTATTDPVGFTTSTIADNSDYSVALPLNRAPALQSTVAGVSGNVVSVNANLSSGQFLYNSVSQTNTYYLSVKSTVSPTSPVKGKWFQVVGNAAGVSGVSAVTVDPDGVISVQDQGLVSGDTVEVIPFWTLNTLFPNGQGITITSDIDSPKDTLFTLPQNVPGTNLQAAQGFLYSNDTNNLPAAGWYDASSFTSASGQGVAWADYPLVPDSFLKFRNRGGPQTITIVGSVPMSDKTTIIARLANNEKQDNFAVNPYPVPLSLPGTNLFESGAFEVTTDIDSPKDLLLVYVGTETGLNAQPSKAYVYANDVDDLPSAGWYDASSFSGPFGNTEKLIPAGASVIIRKTNGAVASLPWTLIKPY